MHCVHFAQTMDIVVRIQNVELCGTHHNLFSFDYMSLRVCEGDIEMLK